MAADLRNLQNPMQDSVETALEAREIGGGADRRPLVDPFGRAISYLRVSVTDRCDFRCVYCMAENMSFLPKAEILTLEELDRLCSAFIARGVRKLRLTGGEPLVRRGIMTLVNSLSRHLRSGQLDELTLTTNGSQLEKYARDLRAAGIRRINVSLDTLDAEKFRAITRWGSLDKVLAGIDSAQSAGLKIKINAVALKNVATAAKATRYITATPPICANPCALRKPTIRSLPRSTRRSGANPRATTSSSIAATSAPPSPAI